MITTSTYIVILVIIGMLIILALDKMRPGFTLFSSAAILMVLGVISPREMLEGFASKEMVTIALLFLIGEGVRRSGAMSYIMRNVLPMRKRRVGGALARILPITTAMSVMLNNTAVVIIFAPMLKQWASRVGIPITKFLIPLSYASIFGGLCSLIGTSTNMIVNGMMIDAGYRGFTLFEIGKVGGVIAVVGLIYLIIFSNMLLPGSTEEQAPEEDNEVKVILAARFPGMGNSIKGFNFERHYGVKIKHISRGGRHVDHTAPSYLFTAGDTLTLIADDNFISTWQDSSAFHIFSTPKEDSLPQYGGRQWIGLGLLLFMIVGTVVGERYGVTDIFPLAVVVMVIMAVTQLFSAKRYTKFISWDVLIAIASAFAISRAMSNSGINELLAHWIINVSAGWGNYAVLAMLYLVTMILSEVITNAAAVAIAFPIAVALSNLLGINAMPLFVAISIAASASFSSPIGYQTNLIVQGIGGYKFKDYIRIGIWLNIITLVITVLLTPLIWSF